MADVELAGRNALLRAKRGSGASGFANDGTGRHDARRAEFLNEIRLTKARHLLEGSTLTLDAIAAKCGYENGFYLSRVFTQKIGMAPSVTEVCIVCKEKSPGIQVSGCQS